MLIALPFMVLTALATYKLPRFGSIAIILGVGIAVFVICILISNGKESRENNNPKQTKSTKKDKR